MVESQNIKSPCKKRGVCCRVISVGRNKKSFRDKESEDAKFIKENWTELNLKETMDIIDDIHSGYPPMPDEMVDKWRNLSKDRAVFKCERLGDEGECTVYDRRPPVCKEYPFYGRNPEDIKKLDLFPGCGYFSLLSKIKMGALVDAIEDYRYNIQNEMDFHKGLEQAFAEAHLEVVHEYNLGKSGNIDFFLDGIGIEVKVKGSSSAVLRQIYKYLECDEVKEIILVTTKNTHRGMPNELLGKSVHVVVISPGLV